MLSLAEIGKSVEVVCVHCLAEPHKLQLLVLGSYRLGSGNAILDQMMVLARICVERQGGNLWSEKRSHIRKWGP